MVVVEELDAIVLVVDETGALSTDSDPPPQETIKKVPAHTKEREG